MRFDFSSYHRHHLPSWFRLIKLQTILIEACLYCQTWYIEEIVHLYSNWYWNLAPNRNNSSIGYMKSSEWFILIHTYIIQLQTHQKMKWCVDEVHRSDAKFRRAMFVLIGIRQSNWVGLSAPLKMVNELP